MKQTISANSDEMTYLEEKSIDADLHSKKLSILETKTDFKNVVKTAHSKTTEKALELGPLESVFSGSTSKVLDFLATYKEWDYSISDIAKNSGISFKTALNDIKQLESRGVVKQTRTVGKATMYKLNLDSKEGQYIDKLAFEIASRRILESN